VRELSYVREKNRINMGTSYKACCGIVTDPAPQTTPLSVKTRVKAEREVLGI